MPDVTADEQKGRRARTATLFATILGSSLGFLDATVVNVAIPQMARDIDLGLAAQQWIVIAYALTLAAAYLPSGAAGDRFGQRSVFIWGTVWFGLTSVLAGIAPNAELLIGARLLQGVGAALVSTSSLSLLQQTYGKDSGKAIGMWVSGTSIATLVGPPLGGAIAEFASWRWIFLINLPFAVLTVIAARMGAAADAAPDTDAQQRKIDVWGGALAAGALAALAYGLVEGPQRGWADVSWALALSALALVALVIQQRRVHDPILPGWLLRDRTFASVNIATLLLYGALSASTFYFALYLQSPTVGYNAFEAGLIGIPISILLALFASWGGRLGDKHGPRLPLVTGPIVLAVGALLWSTVNSQSIRIDSTAPWVHAASFDLLMPGVIVFGIGLVLFVATITATALKAAPESHTGLASAVNNLAARFGGLVAIAMAGAVATSVWLGTGPENGSPFQNENRARAERKADERAFAAAMYLSAALALAAAAVAGFGIKRRSDSE